nr:MAG TPA: hypothetical protein [Caudoviricetes sp.]
MDRFPVHFLITQYQHLFKTEPFNFVDVNKIGSHARLWYNSCCKSVKVLLDRHVWAGEHTLN